MSLRTALAALVAAAPLDATIPVRWLAEQLAADPVTDEQPGATAHVETSTVDLSVKQVAERFGRKGTSTVRTWLARGELPGAYRLHGREWRIPLSAVEAMQTAQAKRHRDASKQLTATPSSDGDVDLSSWRQHLNRRRAGT